MKGIVPVLCLLTIRTAFGQSSIDWNVIAGGGGTSSNGVYQLAATIGQPDTGAVMTGSGYAITGGFWSFVSAVSTPTVPPLRIFLTDTNTLVVAWPAPSSGFALQQTPSLGSLNWSPVTNVVSTIGNENQVILTPQLGAEFYRLSH